MLDKQLIQKFDPIAQAKSIISADGYRISVLTDHIIRVEVNKGNRFTDNPTQTVFYRNFPTPDYSVVDERTLKIVTPAVTFFFDKESKKVTDVLFSDTHTMVKCNNRGNLKGTARTLDRCMGTKILKKGIISKSRVTIMDDSKSLLFNEEGEIIERQDKEKDYYVFAHGKNYYLALKEFFMLTGKIPLIPRYALGNWWSRYKQYTQKEYLDLMDTFEEKRVPLTVATVDMDWHWTDVNKQFGTHYPRSIVVPPYCKGGWTGYSWDTNLFPDYKQFLKSLHEKGLKTTLNLHPADGIRHFETMYPEMCKAMGVDPETKAPVPFDVTDSKFLNAYFDVVHHPYEKEGVDFWWIDWQQGKNTKIKGLDPLYALNHYHYLDNCRDGNHGLILSRYAGLGSHRYPLGFSGDTFVNWKVLKLIPYFTANATNAGYTWWSHDIGGHMFGIKDDELYLRWLQFAVFNPILRLHSTSNDLGGKEPWNCNGVVNAISCDLLRLRKKLIPYIYTMNYLSATESLPLCTPMYYKSPNADGAYKAKNEYYFGSELIVAPVTQKVKKLLGMGRVKAYIPKGRWTDIFTGQIYNGEKTVYLYRDMSSIPVLAKEGAIIPLDVNGTDNGAKLPTALEVMIYRGNNSFTLIEDDEDRLTAKTTFTIAESGKTLEFTKQATVGEGKIPHCRAYSLLFKDIKKGTATLFVNGHNVRTETIKSDEPLIFTGITEKDVFTVVITDFEVTHNMKQTDYVINIMSKLQCTVGRKSRMYKPLRLVKNDEAAFKHKAYNLDTVPYFIRTAFRENEES